MEIYVNIYATMSTPGDFSGLEPDPARISINYAESAANVRARFAIYDLVRPLKDIDHDTLVALRQIGRLPVDGVVRDIGASDAPLYDRLHNGFQFTGQYDALDPHIQKQASMFSRMAFTPEEWLSQSRVLSRFNLDPKEFARLQAEDPSSTSFGRNVGLYEGRAEDLHMFEDLSSDAVFILRVLYHLKKADRLRAYREAQRITKPEGVIVVGSSGEGNKPEPREWEGMISDELGIKAAPIMNAPYTTEISNEELSGEHPCVYLLEHKGVAVIHTRHIETVFRSLESVRDQCDPIPPLEDYRAAMQKKIYPLLRKGTATIHTHRSMAVCTQAPIDKILKYGFTRLI